MSPSLPPELPYQSPPPIRSVERIGLPQIVVIAVVALFLAVVIYLFRLAGDAPSNVPIGEARDLAEVTTRQDQVEPEQQGAESKSSTETETRNTASDQALDDQQANEATTQEKSEMKSEVSPPSDVTRRDARQGLDKKSSATGSAADGSKTLRRARDLAKQSEDEARRGNYGEAFERARDAWELVRTKSDDREWLALTQKLEQDLKRLGDLANREVRNVAPTKPLKER
jgi:hypothetical protein